MSLPQTQGCGRGDAGEACQSLRLQGVVGREDAGNRGVEDSTFIVRIPLGFQKLLSGFQRVSKISQSGFQQDTKKQSLDSKWDSTGILGFLNFGLKSHLLFF